MKRIAVGGLGHESNSFAPGREGYEKFLGGAEMPPMQRGNGMLDLLPRHNCTLLREARATTDQARRQALYAEATARMCEQAPVGFLFTEPYTYAVSNRVAWKVRGDDWLRAFDVTPI